MASRKSSRHFTVHLTRRAVLDFQEIEAHSVQHWGRQVTDRYLNDIQLGLDRIRENPNILRLEQEFSTGLYFYRIAKHWLVCDLPETSVIVVTVIHTSMDVPTRLRELEPRLTEEVAMLRVAVKRQR